MIELVFFLERTPTKEVHVVFGVHSTSVHQSSVHGRLTILV